MGASQGFKLHTKGWTNMVASSVGFTFAAGAMSRRSRKHRNVLQAFEQELGVTLPVGYWDPMGLASDGDMESFRRRREAEIKNGRVAMIASIGYIAPEYFRWP